MVLYPNYLEQEANTVLSPKLLVHVFIGSRISLLVEQDASMPASTKALNYISMLLSAAVGTAVGYIIYRRTMARAAEIARESAQEEGLASPRLGADEGYLDQGDPGDVLAGVDDISLWDGDGGYRDEGEVSPGGFSDGSGKGAGRGE